MSTTSEGCPESDSPHPSVDITDRSLSVPDLPDDAGLLQSALAYAECGWYLAPTAHGSIKHPGSLLGAGWPARTSRDPDVIRAWFSDARAAGIALHVGRSGAVVLDVDAPDALPPVLRAALALGGPVQTTRQDGSRLHVLFTQPPGRMIGNSGGSLGSGWGEIRGTNGVIIVAPSPHPEPGGRYEWLITGTVPALPAQVADELPDGLPRQACLSSERAGQVLATWSGQRLTDATARSAARAVAASWREDLRDGAARHDAAVRAAAWILRDARAGAYPAQRGVEWLRREFIRAMATAPAPGRREMTEQAAEAEFEGILSWTVAQAAAEPEADIADRFDRLVATLGPQATRVDPAPADVFTGEESAPDDEEELARLARREYLLLIARDRARQRYLESTRVDPDPDPPVLLSDLLGEEDTDPDFLITDLWPSGGRVVLSAQRKAGKTTLVSNVIRCLIDGLPLFEKYPATRLTRRVAVLDFEMHRKQLRRWMRDIGIEGTDRVVVVPMKGSPSAFNILDSKVRKEWADRLRDLDVGVMIVDPLRPILDSLGLDEHREAGRMLTALDELVRMAGVSEMLITHHMGHSGERSRGDSRLRDWPEAEWRILRDKSDDPDQEPDPDCPRYFAAEGRDVSIKESEILFDPATRGLSLGAGGRAVGRKTRSASRMIDEVVQYVQNNPRLSSNEICQGVSGKREDLLLALKMATARGLLRVEEGPRRMVRYSATDPTDPWE